MNRGSKTLTGITSNELKKADVNQRFSEKRDMALACRFYFHARLRECRYDVCLRELEKEFFISQTVVAQRLMGQQVFLKELKANNTTAAQLERQYPTFNWGLK